MGPASQVQHSLEAQPPFLSLAFIPSIEHVNAAKLIINLVYLRKIKLNGRSHSVKPEKQAEFKVSQKSPRHSFPALYMHILPFNTNCTKSLDLGVKND